MLSWMKQISKDPKRTQQEATRRAIIHMQNNPPNYKYYRNMAGSKYNERPRKFDDWYNYYLNRFIYENKPYDYIWMRGDDLRYHLIKRWLWTAYSAVYQLIIYRWPRTGYKYKYIGCPLNKGR